MKSKKRKTAFIICLLTGLVGGHLLYLGKHPEFRSRILWMLAFAPVVIVKWIEDASRLYNMTDYQFNAKYVYKKIEGTGSIMGLHGYVNSKIEKK